MDLVDSLNLACFLDVEVGEGVLLVLGLVCPPYELSEFRRISVQKQTIFLRIL